MESSLKDDARVLSSFWVLEESVCVEVDKSRMTLSLLYSMALCCSL